MKKNLTMDTAELTEQIQQLQLEKTSIWEESQRVKKDLLEQLNILEIENMQLLDSNSGPGNSDQLHLKVEQLDQMLKQRAEELFSVNKDYEEAIQEKMNLMEELEQSRISL